MTPSQANSVAVGPTCASATNPCTRRCEKSNRITIELFLTSDFPLRPSPLPGWRFCDNHISQDKTAPFKRCTALHPETKRRCIKSVPLAGPEPALCKLHVNLPKEAASLESDTKPSSKQKTSRKKRSGGTFSSVSEITGIVLRDRRQLLSDIVNKADFAGKVALLGSAEEVEQTFAARRNVLQSRQERLRSLLVEYFVQVIRGELECEREFLFSATEAVDEVASVCSTARARMPQRSVVTDVPMGPPAEKRKVVKKTSVSKAESATPEEPAIAAPPRKKVKVIRPPEPIKKAEKVPKPNDFSATCTSPACTERAVPMTNFCFSRAIFLHILLLKFSLSAAFCPIDILQVPQQRLFQPCAWSECGFPIPKYKTPAHCAVHEELAETLAKEAPKKSEQPKQPTPAPTGEAAQKKNRKRKSETAADMESTSTEAPASKKRKRSATSADGADQSLVALASSQPSQPGPVAPIAWKFVEEQIVDISAAPDPDQTDSQL